MAVQGYIHYIHRLLLYLPLLLMYELGFLSHSIVDYICTLLSLNTTPMTVVELTLLIVISFKR